MSQHIEQEMFFTTYEDSCKDISISPSGDLRECRRARGHWKESPVCASGFGNGYFEWDCDLTGRAA